MTGNQERQDFGVFRCNSRLNFSRFGGALFFFFFFWFGPHPLRPKLLQPVRPLTGLQRPGCCLASLTPLTGLQD